MPGKCPRLEASNAYYHKHQYISHNPTLLVDMPKQHEKAIIRLDADEVALLLDHVESCGESLSGQARRYYEKTKERDLAILTLLLGTGIRVSECVGLDITDVDLIVSASYSPYDTVATAAHLAQHEFHIENAKRSIFLPPAPHS